jgi:hypothetical protein
MNCADQACVTQCEQANPSGAAAEQAFFSCMQNNCSADCQ